MSVNGFKVSNQVHKYNYEALDNLPDLSYTIKNPVADISSVNSQTISGVTFTHNSDDSWSLSGTATANAALWAIYSITAIPSWLDKTKIYYVNFNANYADKVTLNIGWEKNNLDTGIDFVSVHSSAYFKVPVDATGFVMTLFVWNGTNVDGVDIDKIIIMEVPDCDPAVNAIKELTAPFECAPLELFGGPKVSRDSVQSISILNYPSNFFTYLPSSSARSTLSQISFPETYSLPIGKTISVIGITDPDTVTTSYRVSTLEGTKQYAGWCNRATGGYGWREITSSSKSVRVLCIGNSHSQDAMSYVPYVLESMGSKLHIDLAIAYKGSGTIDTAFDAMHNDVANYYELDYKSQDSESWTIIGPYGNDSEKLSTRQILDRGPWDIITFQQGSWLAGTWSTFSNLNKLIVEVLNYHKSVHGKGAKIGWIMTQRHTQDLSTITREQLLACVDKVLRTTPVSFVIPIDTAISNARTDSTLDALGDAGHLSYEGVHLQEGLPVLLASYTAALKLLEVCGYGEEGIIGDPLTPTQQWMNERNTPGKNGSCVVTTDITRFLAQECAELAVKFPREVLTPYYYEDLSDK